MTCRHWILFGTLACLAASGAALSARQDSPAKKPELILTVRPLLGFTPAKFTFRVEVRGGADDYEDFYCANVEWEWDDDTHSEASSDCDPYQPGKSQIRRHFLGEHTYDTAGTYRVLFRLKKKDKIVAAVSKEVEVQEGR